MEERVIVALETILRGVHDIALSVDHRQGEIDQRRGVEQEDQLIGV